MTPPDRRVVHSLPCPRTKSHWFEFIQFLTYRAANFVGSALRGWVHANKLSGAIVAYIRFSLVGSAVGGWGTTAVAFASMAAAMIVS
jgi:hypothetical protein